MPNDASLYTAILKNLHDAQLGCVSQIKYFYRTVLDVRSLVSTQVDWNVLNQHLEEDTYAMKTVADR